LDTAAFERRIEEYKQLKERMGRVRYKIAVMSGKGASVRA